MLLEPIYAICLAIAILIAFLYKHSLLENHVAAWLEGKKRLLTLIIDHRTLVIAGLLVQNLTILFYGVGFDKGAIGRRSARAATLHILPCLIFATRNNPVAFLLKVSHLELRFIHSCYGYLICANATVHLCFVLPLAVYRRPHIGLAFIALSAIAVTKLARSVRQRYGSLIYEDRTRREKMDRAAKKKQSRSLVNAAASHVVHLILSLPVLLSIGFHIPPCLFLYYFIGLVVYPIDRTVRCVNLVYNRPVSIDEICEETIYSDFARDWGYPAPPHHIMAVTAPGHMLARGVKPGAFVYVTDFYRIDQRAEVICFRHEQGNGAARRQVLFLLCPRFHRRSKRPTSIMIEGPYFRSRLLITADPVIVLAPQEAAPFALAYTRRLKEMNKKVETRLYDGCEHFPYQLHRVLQPESISSDVIMVALNWDNDHPGPVHSKQASLEVAAIEDLRHMKAKKDVKTVIVFGSEALEASVRGESVSTPSGAVPRVVGFECLI